MMVIVLSGNRQPQTPMGLSSHSILLSGILGNSLIFSQNFMGFSSFSHRFPGWKSCQATCEHLKPLVLSAFLAGFEPGRRTSDCLARVSEKKANEVTCLFGHVNAVSNVFLCIYTIIHIHIILMFQVLSPPPRPPAVVMVSLQRVVVYAVCSWYPPTPCGMGRGLHILKGNNL